MKNRDEGDDDDDDVGLQWERTGLTGVFKNDLLVIRQRCRWSLP